MVIKLLLDTNTVIDLLSGNLPYASVRGIRFQARAISIITKIELFSWQFADEEYQQMLNNFLYQTKVIGLEDEVVRLAIQIRRNKIWTKLPDVIIAATAMSGGYTLVTNNLSDFKNIPGLQLQGSHSV